MTVGDLLDSRVEQHFLYHSAFRAKDPDGELWTIGVFDCLLILKSGQHPEWADWEVVDPLVPQEEWNGLIVKGNQL